MKNSYTVGKSVLFFVTYSEFRLFGLKMKPENGEKLALVQFDELKFLVKIYDKGM